MSPETAKKKEEKTELPEPDRVMIFIDGQNLFYGCGSYEHGFTWDYDKFVSLLTNLAPNRRLVEVYYHGSIAPIDPKRAGDDVRYRKQQMFYNVLRGKCKAEIKITKLQSVNCPLCNQTFKEPKEKGVDVALAADLLTYGMNEDYDVAILVSGDSDYIPVLKKLSDRKPDVKIEIAQFSKMAGNDLRDCGFKFHPLELYAQRFRREGPQA
ncbi:MAG: NYN domain-containing protein [Candidatus Bathyarchaeia archaeon]